MKDYCTQPMVKYCSICNLASYNRDCMNNPIEDYEMTDPVIEEAEDMGLLHYSADAFLRGYYE